MRDESHQHPLAAIIRAQTHAHKRTQGEQTKVKWLARISVGGQNSRLFDYGGISETERRQLCGVSAANDRP